MTDPADLDLDLTALRRLLVDRPGRLGPETVERLFGAIRAHRQGADDRGRRGPTSSPGRADRVRPGARSPDMLSR